LAAATSYQYATRRVEHTTLATGVYPTHHGIVANTWSEFEEGEWRSAYSMEDLNRSNLDRRGLPDWIMDADPDSRVVSISRKDRAAIGLAAKAAGDVYRLIDGGGGWPARGSLIRAASWAHEYPKPSPA